ncbi:MAG: DUF4446 family protein [Tissierellia bacterium]|nr:DUF4446 family protein [Tissierellia bacterium]
MEAFMNFIQTANVVLFIVLLIAVVFCFMVLSQTNRKLNRLRRRYDMLLRGRGEMDMEALIASHGADIEKNADKIREIQEEISSSENLSQKKLDDIMKKSAISIQKIGFHRYNAFDYISNEMSFSLALLDSRSNGIIITSIFGRESSTTYAKEIRKARGLQELSEEEKIALERALREN